jgi:hypothetical protein
MCHHLEKDSFSLCQAETCPLHDKGKPEKEGKPEPEKSLSGRTEGPDM